MFCKFCFRFTSCEICFWFVSDLPVAKGSSLHGSDPCPVRLRVQVRLRIPEEERREKKQRHLSISGLSTNGETKQRSKRNDRNVDSKLIRAIAVLKLNTKHSFNFLIYNPFAIFTKSSMFTICPQRW